MVVNIGYAPLAPMIGRDDDVAVLTGLLSAHRLVSVVGPGGVGKTLLATETVAAVADRYANGVRIVELAALRDSSLVVEEICSANSTNRRSMMVELTVPRLAMVCDSSRISSSSMWVKSLVACSSPSASIMMAAFSGPVRVR